ncbi:MAG TPA: hypothetical protein VMX16_07505 [Terriglobia bacterium]|nr:hypothetical protein [Terriglobia bacterium]
MHRKNNLHGRLMGWKWNNAGPQESQTVTIDNNFLEAIPGYLTLSFWV